MLFNERKPCLSLLSRPRFFRCATLTIQRENNNKAALPIGGLQKNFLLFASLHRHTKKFLAYRFVLSAVGKFEIIWEFFSRVLFSQFSVLSHGWVTGRKKNARRLRFLLGDFIFPATRLGGTRMSWNEKSENFFRRFSFWFEGMKVCRIFWILCVNIEWI